MFENFQSEPLPRFTDAELREMRSDVLKFWGQEEAAKHGLRFLSQNARTSLDFNYSANSAYREFIRRIDAARRSLRELQERALVNGTQPPTDTEVR